MCWDGTGGRRGERHGAQEPPPGVQKNRRMRPLSTRGPHSCCVRHLCLHARTCPGIASAYRDSAGCKIPACLWSCRSCEKFVVFVDNTGRQRYNEDTKGRCLFDGQPIIRSMNVDRSGPAGRSTSFWRYVHHDQKDQNEAYQETKDSHPTPFSHRLHLPSQGSG